MNNETKGVKFETLDKMCDIFDCEIGDLIIRKKRNRRSNNQYIIDSVVSEIKNIDLLNTSVSELYNSINNIQQNKKNIQ